MAAGYSNYKQQKYNKYMYNISGIALLVNFFTILIFCMNHRINHCVSVVRCTFSA